MQIRINGEARDVADGVTLSGLLDHMHLAGRRLAVEVNEEVVPRSRHGEVRLEHGDRVEIVHAIGGG